MEVHCKHTKLVPVSELKENPNNPNVHTTEQIERLAKVLKVQGWRNPIVVSNRSGCIVKGHGRLEAGKLAGFDKVPVDFQDYESEEMEFADLIADNRIAELSKMDNDKLKDALQQIDNGSLDMDITGYDQKELGLLMTQVFQGDDTGKTPDDYVDDWNNTTVRQIILIYDESNFDEILAKIGRIRDKHALDNNTDAVTMALNAFEVE